jgi:plastocyanin
MMKKSILTAGAVLFFLSTMLVVIDREPVGAQESQLVRIFGGIETGAGELKKPIRLEPAALTVTKGGVVVWMNWARSVECIQVSFEDGKKCDDVTDAPTGFDMSSGCYVTSWITFGGTSSLRFNEPGTYTYTVEAKTGGQTRKETGKIMVVSAD